MVILHEGISITLSSDEQKSYEIAMKVAASNFRRQIAINRANAPCPKGGIHHEWGIDGAHSNEYCKKCFTDSMAEIERRDRLFPNQW